MIIMLFFTKKSVMQNPEVVVATRWTYSHGPSLPHLTRLGRVRTWAPLDKPDWSPAFDQSL